MTEIEVVQGTQEWLDMRSGVQITASRFGDAIGVGQGKPVDFMKSVLYLDKENASESTYMYMKHGQDYECIINEAYQLLTGNKTVKSGFWIPPQSDPLHSLVGASPDGKVVQENGNKSSNCIGLVEYKAPMHGLYDPKKNLHGMPRSYMAQIQGQMAVCGKPWCDFMAVCASTKEIMLKRIYFNQVYWSAISAKLRRYATVFKEAKLRQQRGMEPLAFPEGHSFSQWPMQLAPFPGEKQIAVKDLIQRGTRNRYKCERGPWLDFHFLVGDIQALQVPGLSPWKVEMQVLKIDREINSRKRLELR